MPTVAATGQVGDSLTVSVPASTKTAFFLRNREARFTAPLSIRRGDGNLLNISRNAMIFEYFYHL